MAGSATKKVTFVFLATLAIVVRCIEAGGNVVFDDHLREQERIAYELALKTYVPDPLEVTFELNHHVNLFMNKTESRRNLMKIKRRNRRFICEATNPIDGCWRCDPNWARNRFRLAECAKGFGRRAKGGLGGPIYVVTDESDDDMINPRPGTLRYGVLLRGPVWIIFARSMLINLKQELIVTSDKTIDGRGANIQIRGGAGLTLQFVNNVIIHGIRIKGVRSRSGGMIRSSADHIGLRMRSDGDGITIFGSSNVWIDHISMSDCEDGLIDVVAGSTGITISNCHMTKHNDVMLFGADDRFTRDKIMQVTVVFNHFGQGLIQRMPRCRFGFFHVLNNDYTHWLMYAIGGSSNPTILSQGNRFIAPNNMAAKEVTHRDYARPEEWANWQWRSENDLFMNNARFVESGAPITNLPFRGFLMTPRHGSHANRLTSYAGALTCVVGRPC
ncbi:hypothetical protein HN51_032756 [Arachis hypogaea]|uniref:Pectate lyase n=1 Tax=Arachis hypogaea TaxID=3818 RepID=A0A445B3E2_ARAHY|nr:pectate lyase [Arachis hypogaea]QHO17124.1 putative pectate lyase [Arachis hypogaea]RYR33156.1 hypothetical protein Ahy_A10g047719 [Arachis hypogaea]